MKTILHDGNDVVEIIELSDEDLLKDTITVNGQAYRPYSGTAWNMIPDHRLYIAVEIPESEHNSVRVGNP